MSEIFWREEAEEDLLEIWRFIAADSPADADRHIEKMRSATRRLVAFPDSGHFRDDLPNGCRAINVGRYLIVYRTAKGRVEILAAIHGSRLLDDLAQRFA
jgi:toxin ParE1/3/4